MFSRWFYLWCILVCVILIDSLFHYVHIGTGWVHLFRSSRWIYFLIYAAVVAVPVGIRQRGSGTLLSLAPIFAAIALDSLASDPLFVAVRPQIIPAELFGVAAGILLGLNLRVMRKAQASSLETDLHKPSSPSAL